MLKTKYFIILIVFFCSKIIIAQNIEISGYVQSEKDIENIHVINKTAQLFTVTNANGEFKILASINDTIVFTSIQHKTQNLIVDKNIMSSKTCLVKLEEQINELDEVTVGKILTGNLYSDINNTEGDPPINFYDVGIPGYTGKIATQSERRLSEAGEFKPKMLLGLLAGGVPLNPILNGISGRTKELKNRVKLEKREALMQSIKSRLSKDFLLSNPLEDDLVADFFYFCADDKNFIMHCENKSDFKILIFLRMKYRQYLENINSIKD